MRLQFIRIISALCLVALGFNIFFQQMVSAAEVDTKFSMSYVYFGNTSAYSDMVANTNSSLDDISPSYFNLNEDGSLKLSESLDIAFIKDMHSKGIKVTPFLSNHWVRQTGRNALAKRDSLVTQIMDAINEYDLDGINVDIENLTGIDRDNLTDFVRILRQRLPVGKSLSVAVAPLPYTTKTEWQKSYDYAGIANYADYLMLMTYDEHCQGGSIGPVASVMFVENSVKNALKEVPANKIVLGLAFYGRYWKEGATYGGYGINANRVDELVRKYRGVVKYDYNYQSPKAVITVKSSDTKPYVLGNRLDAGKYDIWYENEQSLKKKLALVKKYNLKGSGSWSLGQESNNTWDYYKLWLNGYYFGDAEGSFAVNSIINVANMGWMVGVSATEFQPGNTLTRAQAAAVLVRAMGLKSVSGNTTMASGFNDVSGHWAEQEIEIARQNNIIQGIGNGSFGPDMPVTREQIAIMMARLPVQYDVGSYSSISFADVSADANEGSYSAIQKLAQAGVLQGFTDGFYRPRSNLTRAQMAVIMDRSSRYFI